MRISKWVDMGAEVDIDIDAKDVSAALSEAFSRATRDELEEKASREDVLRALNNIGCFLRAVSDDMIAQMNDAQRRVVANFLDTQSKRFSVNSDQQLTPANAGSPVNTEAR